MNPHCDRYGDNGVAARRRVPRSSNVNASFEAKAAFERTIEWREEIRRSAKGLPDVNAVDLAEVCGHYGGINAHGLPCQAPAVFRRGRKDPRCARHMGAGSLSRASQKARATRQPRTRVRQKPPPPPPPPPPVEAVQGRTASIRINHDGATYWMESGIEPPDRPIQLGDTLFVLMAPGKRTVLKSEPSDMEGCHCYGCLIVGASGDAYLRLTLRAMEVDAYLLGQELS